MNRSTRTVVVLVIAIALASVSTYLVYQAILNRPARVVEVAQAYAVVAARPLTLGTMVTAADVKQVPWPAANPVPGGFTSLEQVVDRGIISPVAENEPLTANNLATKEAGAGLPPTIPTGMRALSVRVNEVIGVAGFVVPGTRVDVMCILRDAAGTVARTVVSNVQVLTAGTKYDQDTARQGEPIKGTTVVTLMLSPGDAERVGLAATEGQILLTLRNPLDTAPTESTGTRTSNLTSGTAVAAAASNAPSTPRPRRAAVVEPPPPPPPPPPADKKVEVIKAGAKTQEIIKK
jgi:pilus assembly protein CpaB